MGIMVCKYIPYNGQCRILSISSITYEDWKFQAWIHSKPLWAKESENFGKPWKLFQVAPGCSFLIYLPSRNPLLSRSLK